jgi:hypothetical protein
MDAELLRGLSAEPRWGIIRTMNQLVSHPVLRRLDALLLAALLFARIRIDTFAEAAVLPLRQNDIARHPFLGTLLSPAAMKLLAEQQLVDPIGLLLIVFAIGLFVVYLLVDEFVAHERPRYGIKLVLIWAIVLSTVFAPSLKLALLRHDSGPASYSHDGGVIQTEATIEYLLSGRNPYVENYLNTPMAEWGINEFRTALHHYPYLPWTFLFSALFKLLALGVLGWYDQRFVYLLLFALTLLLLPGLARTPVARLLLVMIIGLNPIMGTDLIYGQNDSFVLAWLVLSLWLWSLSARGRRGRVWVWAAAAAFGLACASKPTAWFLMPFYLLVLAGGDPSDAWRHPAAWIKRAAATVWPALAVPALIIGPYLLWDPAALIDDVWAWSNGASPTAYQIWGWGASNLVLASGLVTSRFAYWPFWLPQLLFGLPLLLALLWRQARENSANRALWSYALFLLVFFFVSRFMNENYLGHLLAVMALGALVEVGAADRLYGQEAA